MKSVLASLVIVIASIGTAHAANFEQSLSDDQIIQIVESNSGYIAKLKKYNDLHKDDKSEEDDAYSEEIYMSDIGGIPISVYRVRKDIIYTRSAGSEVTCTFMGNLQVFGAGKNLKTKVENVAAFCQ